MSNKKKKSKENNVTHLIPTSVELQTEPEGSIKGTELKGASLGSLLFYTDDLDQFQLIPGNRIVRESRIQKLTITMKAWGWLYNQPATVTPSGGVVDGQGRYVTASRLGKGMFFTILDPTIPEDEAIKVFNEAQESWSFEDYFSGLKTAELQPFAKLWDTWKALDEEFETNLSPTAFLSAFGIYRKHLKGEFLPEDYNFKEGLHTIREIAMFAEQAPSDLSTAFKHTKTIDAYRDVRSHEGWLPDNVIKTLQVSHDVNKRTAWRDGLTTSSSLGRRMAFVSIHNWKKSSTRFEPPKEWWAKYADDDI